MLQVTEAAAAVLGSMREQAGAPEEAGVRIQRARTDEGQEVIGLAFRDAPDDGDAITEQAGVRVFVEGDLTQMLDEAVLDARPTEDGAELVVRQ